MDYMLPQDIIKRDMKERNISQRSLAKLLNVEPSLICKLLNGRLPISVRRSVAIAQALDTDALPYVHAIAMHDYYNLVSKKGTDNDKE